MLAPSPYRINFSVQFSVWHIHITRIFKTVFHFSYFSVVFEKWENLSRQELLFSHILKQCYIPRDLRVIRKKADTVLINIHLSCVPLKILKRCCNVFGTWSLPSTTHSNHLKKQDRNFTSLVALIFLWIWCFIIWFFTCVIFWLHLLIKWLEAAIHRCGRKIVVLLSKVLFC